jgi:hypothetical protein
MILSTMMNLSSALLKRGCETWAIYEDFRFGICPSKGTVDPRPTTKIVKSESSFEILKAAESSKELIDEISAFLDSQDTSHPFQFPQWSGRAGFLAIYRRAGRIQLFAQCGTYRPAGRVLGPICALIVNRGPVCDDLESLRPALSQLVRKAKDWGFTLIDINPEWTGSFAESAQAVLALGGWEKLDLSRMSLRLNLDSDLEYLLAGFRKVTRYEIRRCEKLGIDASFATSEQEYEEWLGLYRHMAKLKKFSAESPTHIRGVLRWLRGEPRRGGLLLARQSGKCVGGVIVARSGGRCFYLFGATSKDDMISAGHLLQWRALQWAKENGCQEYDFGGYLAGAKTGPAFFKSGFCQNVVRFSSAHRYVLSDPRYRIAKFIQGMRRTLQHRSD